ncbi:hypothetical protein PVT67_11630 [Gallaecimonas kandeliae]|uniref:hypothetical protein n=1 Tax=Gallaecimonas kandeliae TaxID=3029055 RepID=UPI002649622A|nr:hypothetical protein [Gallaecimonas kandeliae]WKE64330.1 hypothetical protein PVT67_11630 [Gallaecimonas kandeliae]
MNQDWLTPEMQQMLRSKYITAILMVRLDFASGVVALHSGTGDVVHEGTVYRGVGVLGRVSQVRQENAVRPYTLRLTLSGIPQELAQTALTEKYQGRDGQLLLGAMDSFHQVTATQLLFRGRMDVMPVNLGNPSTIALDINSRSTDWKRPRNARYTDADQQARHPGDRFFEFVGQMAEKEIFWGVPGKAVASGGGGSARGRGQAVNER